MEGDVEAAGAEKDEVLKRCGALKVEIFNVQVTDVWLLTCRRALRGPYIHQYLLDNVPPKAANQRSAVWELMRRVW